MSRVPYPLLLMLAMSLPSTVRALGLGDIHVDSALNEPLSAQIDLIGATPQELLDLRAAIADKDIFQRYNADRPAFLNSATFKVGRDAQGRPVLTVQSREAFTDPVVSLLVDVRWPHGAVVREYSLLLDPPGFNSHPDSMFAATPVAPAAPIAQIVPAAPAAARRTNQVPVQATARAALVRATPRTPATVANTTTAPAHLASNYYRVADKDTLSGIARRAGAASAADAKRLMSAIFRANPHAFAGNINRLHRGADLQLPSADMVAAIATADAQREVRAHMSAWQLHVPVPQANVPTLGTSVSLPAAAIASAPTATLPADVLKDRVLTLEQSLDDMKKILASEDAKMLGLQNQVTRAESVGSAGATRSMATTAATLVPAAAAAETEAAEAAPAREAARALDAGTSLGSRVGPFAALAGILIAGFAVYRYRRPEKLARPMELSEAELTNTAVLDATQVDGPALAREAETLMAAASAAPATKTANDTLGMEVLTLDSAELDPYGIDTASTAKMLIAGSSGKAVTMDLDATGEHVQMPSGLHDHVVVAESRTNIIEVLKGAIDRDPQRRDLRLKLLEVYYSAAAHNQRAFLEVATALSHEREHLSRDEWDKVARMGREIAAGSSLFAARNDGDELAVA